MSRRRKHLDHVNHERWLVSYADFITLLFAFFVVLYASSQMDKAKMGKLSEAIEGGFQQLGVFQGASPSPALQVAEAREMIDAPESSQTNNENEPLGPRSSVTGLRKGPTGLTAGSVEKLKQELEKALAAEIDRREVALTIGPDGLVISLREIGFFESGSAVLKTASKPAVTRVATLLHTQNVALRIEGHTDDVPIHTAHFKSNWELSTARATEIVRVLISTYAFSPNSLSAAGYGEFHPVATNSTFDGRRQNRRVDIVILAGNTLGEGSAPDRPEQAGESVQ